MCQTRSIYSHLVMKITREATIVISILLIRKLELRVIKQFPKFRLGLWEVKAHPDSSSLSMPTFLKLNLSLISGTGLMDVLLGFMSSDSSYILVCHFRDNL